MRRGSQSSRRRSSITAHEPAAVPLAFRPVLQELASRPGVVVEPGWGKGNLVAKLAGKMFVLLIDGGLVVKLPKTRVDSLIQEHAGSHFDPRRNGQVMKEWVVISERSADWVALSLESLAFVTKGGRDMPGEPPKRRVSP